MLEIDPDPDGQVRIHPEDLSQWRAWLAEHHDRESGAWVAMWRKQSGRDGLTYEDLVQGCLAFGWIDAVTRTLDEDRTLRYCAPRRRGSGWARTNKVRIAQLEAQGLMEPPGAAVIAAAQADGSWTLLDDVEDLVVPDDLAAALASRDGARAHWDAFRPSVRKMMLTQVVMAKRPATRIARIDRIASEAAQGRRAYG